MDVASPKGLHAVRWQLHNLLEMSKLETWRTEDQGLPGLGAGAGGRRASQACWWWNFLYRDCGSG